VHGSSRLTLDKRPPRQRLQTTFAVLTGNGGVHAFRRFRISVLRKARAPEDLISLWLGHAGQSGTDDYARQLRTDVSLRKEWAEKCGLGFELGDRGLPGYGYVSVAKAA
jgi:integrase